MGKSHFPFHFFKKYKSLFIYTYVIQFRYLNPGFSMDSAELLHGLSSYFSTILAFLRQLLTGLLETLRIPFYFTLVVDVVVSTYYKFCGLSPLTVDLDDQTTMHFWTPYRRQFHKPNLVMIHGYGGDTRLQFIYQVPSLSQKFNLYLPDLLFFGKSYSKRPDRTDMFQASCVVKGLKKLGVDRFSVYSISYGGYVAYEMAEMYPKEVEKVVIVSTGVGCSEEQKREQLKKIGRDPKELLLPATTSDLRQLVNLTVYKCNPIKWFPDIFLEQFMNVLGNTNIKEKSELVDHLLAKKADKNLPIITQETLLIWGDHDNVFPIALAFQLQRHLGPKCRIEIIMDTGHAANVESPEAVNELIASFVLGQS